MVKLINKIGSEAGLEIGNQTSRAKVSWYTPYKIIVSGIGHR